MRVTDKTLFARVAGVEPYFTPETKTAIQDRAIALYGGMYELTVEQFAALVAGNYKSVLGELARPTVMQVYWLRRFKEFVEEFAGALKNLQPPKDADEAIAAANLPKISPAESMLIFARNYFGLHSFDEASRVTLAEFLIAKRDVYITALYHQRLARAKKNKKK